MREILQICWQFISTQKDLNEMKIFQKVLGGATFFETRGIKQRYICIDTMQQTLPPWYLHHQSPWRWHAGHNVGLYQSVSVTLETQQKFCLRILETPAQTISMCLMTATYQCLRSAKLLTRILSRANISTDNDSVLLNHSKRSLIRNVSDLTV